MVKSKPGVKMITALMLQLQQRSIVETYWKAKVEHSVQSVFHMCALNMNEGTRRRTLRWVGGRWSG